MKKILLVLLIVPVVLFGQKWEDNESTKELNFHNVGAYHPPTPKQDTIPVIILCSDTSAKWFNGKDYYNASVEWRLGYEVVEPINNMLWWNNIQIRYTESGFPFIHKEYLDGKKNPMPNKIMVWMSKEIKN